MSVYIGFMILLSFLTNYLLLLGTDRLTGFSPSFRGILSGAALGAAYSGASLTPSFSFLLNPGWYLVFTVLCCCLAFGADKSALRRGILYFLLSLILMGMAAALRQNQPQVLILLILSLLLILKAGLPCPGRSEKYLPVTVHSDGKDLHFTALLDTGNHLKDPLTGEAVMVISPKQANLLTGLSSAELAHPLDTMVSSPLRGMRLIPYQSVGTGTGLLLGMRFPSVTLGSRQGPALLAFAPAGLGDNGKFDALTGGSLC